MSARASYFRIGMFVIVATMIIVVLISVLGATALFRDTVLVETYFEESVQGLDAGSTVRFRGVVIGKVDRITLAGGEYPTRRPYVLVRMSLYPDEFPADEKNDLIAQLQTEAKKGMRARLASQGLTGTLYIEVDYFDPDRFPPLPIDWVPKAPYLPSAPSTITQFTDALDHIMRSLENLNLDGITGDIQKTLQAMTRTLEGANLNSVTTQAEALLAEARYTNRQVQQALGAIDIESLRKETVGTLGAIRKETESTLESIRRVVNNAEKPMTTLLKDLSAASRDIRQLSGKLNTSVESVPPSVEQFRGTLRRLDQLIAGQQYDIRTTIENLRVMSENLRELSEDAKRYPSHVLFGEPPNPSKPGQKP